MSRKSIADLLRDILTELDDIASYAVIGKQAFMTDRKTRKAIERSYEIAGEIVKRLPDDFIAQTAHMRWHRLTGFRDFLAHNYEEIIIENIWIAVEDLPNLYLAIKTLLDTLQNEKEDTP